jgi:DNA-binding response OmpR family regulator
MSKRIMIVDDEEDIRVSVGQIFEVSGYEVTKAEDGNDCLNKLERAIPDLVILDIMMPGMNGWDVAARIKENSKWSKIPIVFLTAKGDEMSIGMGGLASKEYIVKPFDIIKLKERVEEILNSNK